MMAFISLAERFKRRFLPIHHDAVYHPAESYYGSIYLDVIQGQLAKLGERRLKILEAGCGTGRILVPLAKLGHELTGIDWHKDSLRLAKENLSKVGEQANLYDGDLVKKLWEFPAAAFDAILAIEVLYNCPQYKAVIARMSELLQPGGYLLISHRTRFYYLVQNLARKQFTDALYVARNKAGRLPKGQHRIYYNWQTSADLDELYGSAGMKILLKYPIGPYSGFAPDPLETVCDPGKLSENERQLLREIEMNYDRETQMAARYVLVVAQK